MNLLHKIYNSNILKFGEFKLSHGGKSNIYIDCRVLFDDLALLNDIADALIAKVSAPFEAVCGVPYGGIPLATLIAAKTNTKLVVLRKETKNHGTKCNHLFMTKCLLVDDVITTGSSIQEAIQKLNNNGLLITQVITVFNREPIENFNRFPIENFNRSSIKDKRVSLFTLADLMAFHSKQQIIDQLLQSSRVCVAADLTDKQDVLNLIQALGDHISIVKLHSDIIRGFDEQFIDDLNMLAKEKQLILFDDRKYTDIYNTVKLQYQAMDSNKWVHITTINPTTLEEPIRAITDQNPNIMILIIYQMTSPTILNEENQRQIINIAEKYANNILGFVCSAPEIAKLRRAVGNRIGPYVVFTPGIALKPRQGRVLPQEAYSSGADMLVVGRNIYTSADPVKAIRMCSKL